ncbi:MAG: hypothetical protein ACLTUZ_11290 [Sellimonas intestinalis]|uniref:hypothetical protein n=1 Tax=Sellimonas intestinalis TaxID=1653434 RepID=UPI0039912D91
MDNIPFGQSTCIHNSEVMILIVETVKVKNATIRVHDDCYAERTEEEVKSLIDGCCRIIQEALLRKEKTA